VLGHPFTSQEPTETANDVDAVYRLLETQACKTPPATIDCCIGGLIN